MSQRPSIYVSRRLPTPKPVSPNLWIPQVTTELRSIAPPDTPFVVLAYELSMAVREFQAKSSTWPGSRATTIEQAASELAAYGISVPPGAFDGAEPFPGPGPSS